jgi:FG-GAP-like repeat/Abnormal spindle-like microcephaly-assoc'd, ASPM-SPD-2-Hydin
MKSVGLVSILMLLGIVAASAQTNPVPFIDQPLVPTAAAPGTPGFTLMISGSNFVSGSVVDWNGVPLPTTFGSRTQVVATVAASDVASAGTAFITVVNPVPGGGVSNVAFFQIATPESTVVLSQTNNIVSDVWSVITADFNGDGKLDLAATGTDSQNNPIVFILLGNGDGTFQAPVSYPISFPDVIVAPIITGDFNGDGKLDVIAGLTVLLGNGDGTFQEGITLPASIGSALVAGDFNGDGKLDFAGLNNYPSQLLVMLGNGDGTFQAQTPIQIPFAGVYIFGGLLAADFNGDGILDLAFSGNGLEHGSGEIPILLGNGDGTFQTALLAGDGAGGVLGLAAADFNRDGKQDLASSFYFEPTLTDGLAVAVGSGDGNFIFNNYADALVSGAPVFSGDFNADGKLDLAMDGAIVLGNGDGTFQTPGIAVPNILEAVGDFNGDGRLDLIVSDHSANISLLLQTVTGVAAISPAALAFSTPQLAGTLSSAKVVTFSNTGNSALAITSISTAGTNAGDFSETNTCGSTLAVNASCNISVTFTPTVGGTRSAVVQITDNALGSPQTVSLTGTGQDFSLAASGQTTATVTPGQSASYTISIAPGGGFNQTVTLNCSGAPTQSTCSVSPSSIALGGISATTATVTVATAASASLTPPTGGPSFDHPLGLWVLFSGTLGLALLLGIMPHRRKWRPQLLCGVTLLWLLLIGVTMTACGGGGSSSGGTPAGTYNLTVIGSYTAGSATLTHSTKLTLIVQ